MGRLIKYELKGNYKIISGVLIIMALLNIFLLSKKGIWGFDNIIGLTILTDFAAFIFIFIYLVNSFKRELYEDRGYLTFTLPVKGSDIVSSKLIVALIWFTVAAILAGIFILLLNKPYISLIFKGIRDNIGIVTLSFLSNILGTVILMSMIYFSISLSKVAIKSKMIGGVLSFIIFVGLSILIVYIQLKLINAFPQAIILGKGMGSDRSIHIGNGSLLQYSVNGMEFNIASAIFNILLVLGLFFSTSFIIEKKIDL